MRSAREEVAKETVHSAPPNQHLMRSAREESAVVTETTKVPEDASGATRHLMRSAREEQPPPSAATATPQTHQHLLRSAREDAPAAKEASLASSQHPGHLMRSAREDASPVKEDVTVTASSHAAPAIMKQPLMRSARQRISDPSPHHVPPHADAPPASLMRSERQERAAVQQTQQISAETQAPRHLMRSAREDAPAPDTSLQSATKPRHLMRSAREDAAVPASSSEQPAPPLTEAIHLREILYVAVAVAMLLSFVRAGQGALHRTTAALRTGPGKVDAQKDAEKPVGFLETFFGLAWKKADKDL